MFNTLKSQAVEVDTKLKSLRKQCTTFSCGFNPKDDTKEETVRDALTTASRELHTVKAECDSFMDEVQNLQAVLIEAEKTADEIFDSVIELYQHYGVEVPVIDIGAIPVGVPLREKATEEESPDPRDGSDEGEGTCSGDSVVEEDFESEIYITRPVGEGGCCPDTPMIRTRKKLF